MQLVVNAETAAKVDELQLFETSTSQRLSYVEQHRQTLSASHRCLRQHRFIVISNSQQLCNMPNDVVIAEQTFVKLFLT